MAIAVIDETKEEKYGTYTETILPPRQELAFYTLEPANLAKFEQFYHQNVLQWMAKYNLKDARCWLVGNSLVVWCPAIPWDGPIGIPGLGEFLSKNHSSVVALPDLNTRK